MLNAFRHQRSEQTAASLPVSLGDMCSTPFGIKDRNSDFNLVFFQAFDVLNAFRHQRSEQRGLISPKLRLISAQRLSASKIGTADVLSSRYYRGPVLNAFRHQRSEQSPALHGGFPDQMCSTPFGIKDWNRLVSFCVG